MSDNLIEYIKLHLISLEQDKELIEKSSLGDDSIDWHYVAGAIGALKHILNVYDEQV